MLIGLSNLPCQVSTKEIHKDEDRKQKYIERHNNENRSK